MLVGDANADGSWDCSLQLKVLKYKSQIQDNDGQKLDAHKNDVAISWTD